MNLLLRIFAVLLFATSALAADTHPGGVNKALQYNNNGYFGGIAEVDGSFAVGSSGAWIARAIVAGDIPTLNQNTTGSAAKWTTARLLAGNSVDGSANVPFANKFIVQGTTDTGLSNAQFLGALGTGLLKNTTSTGVLSIAASGTDYEVPLTFSTGLTRSTNTVTVNASQNISTLSNLTSNGFVKTSGGTGALSIDTSTYLTGNQTITLSGDTTGSGATAITTTTGKVNGVAYPAAPSTNTVPVVTGANTVTYQTVPNAALANSSVTVAGKAVSLGGSTTVACSDLSNGATGCSTATGTSGATIPLLNGTNTWSGVQSINSGNLALKGATSGSITLNAAATAGSNTITLPAGTTDFSATGGASRVVKQTSAGGAFTVAQLANTDITGLGTASTQNTGTSGANVPLLNGANTWSGVQTLNKALIVTPSVPSISTSTFNIDASLSNTFRIVLVHASCPCTIANPTNAVDGEKILIEMVQSATGSDTIGTWGTNFSFGTAGTPTLTTGANKEDFLGFQYSTQNSKWNYLGIQQGM